MTITDTLPGDRWLVTGGAGFFGLHMLAGLARRGIAAASYDIAAIPPAERPAGVEEIRADVRDEAALRAAVRGRSVVVHAAAALALADPAEIEAVNAGGTRLLLRLCAEEGVRRVVLISSTSVYGVPEVHPIAEDAPLHPLGHYGRAKAAAERACLEARGVETVVIRPKSFIGTGRLGIFQILFDWIECGKRIYLLGDGSNRFQLLDVADLVDAVVLAAERGADHGVYNIGAAEFRTTGEDVGALLAHAATGSRLVRVPARPAKLALAALEALRLSPVYRWVYDTADKDSYVSIERAVAELGFAPRFSNQDTLIRTYDWYLREGKELAKAHGTSHRTAWKQGALKLLKLIS